MKIRNGFVSNSSSSSFILGYKGEFHNVVQKALTGLLEIYHMNTPKNVKLLLQKVQQHTYEDMAQYKRELVNYLSDQASYWFDNVSDYSKQIRAQWQEEDPKGYQEHVERMEFYRDKPILAAEQIIQKQITDDMMSDKLMSVIGYLNDGYKVCTFDLEYSGDVADEHQFPNWKELHHFTHELVQRMNNDGYDGPLLNYDHIKLERVS